MKLIVHPQYERFRSFLENLPKEFDREGEVIYKGRNVLKKFVVEGFPLVVKRFRKPHIINRFIYVSFRSSKACRSYEHGLKLEALGIPTPAPIGYIEEYDCGLAYSYYISGCLEQMQEMRMFVHHPELVRPKAYLLEAFGVFTAELHRKGIYHKDYSSGNILFTENNHKPEFYLIDINRMSFGKPVGEEAGYKNFQRMWLPEEAFVLIAKAYARSAGYNEQHAVERICYYKDRFMKSRS